MSDENSSPVAAPMADPYPPIISQKQDAHAGLVVVKASGWTGYYVNGRLVRTMSPYANAEGSVALVAHIVKALEQPVAFASAEWVQDEPLLPAHLSMLTLEMKEPVDD